MDGKKIAVAIVLVVVIGVAASIIKRSTGGSAKPPRHVFEREVEKIDKETGELITLQLVEWQDIGPNDKGLYKNPNTKKFTMTTPRTCGSCNEKIAGPDLPRVSMDDPEAAMAAESEHRKILQEYVCPKCSKKAFPNSL